MALPKLSTPEFNTVIPSTKEDIKFRPFLVKEEKILYMALEGGEQRGARLAAAYFRLCFQLITT